MIDLIHNNKLKKFLEKQIEKGNIDWESRGKLIKASGEKKTGNNNKIIKKFEDKFNFGSNSKIDQKNKAIKKYFDKLPKNSIINVLGAKDEINKNLPKDNQIGGERSCTIIYSRLDDPKFNTNNLKAQTLDNQISKTKLYQVSISKEFEEKVNKLNSKGFYVNIEDTQAGNKTIRLEVYKYKKSQVNSEPIISGKESYCFPPNEESLKKIKKLINER